MQAHTKIVCKALRKACRTLGVRVIRAYTDSATGSWITDANDPKRYVCFCVDAKHVRNVVSLATKILAAEGYDNEMWARPSNPGFLTCVSFIK